MGRPPKPLERLKATQRNDDTKANGSKLPARIESSSDLSIPEPPSDLTGRGEVEWRKMWAAGHWLHRDADYHWVEQVCQAYMDIEEFRAQVKQDGLVVKGYAGQDAAHPLIAEIRKAQAQIQACLSKLGFSPTDRAKLNILAVKAQDDFEKFLAKHS